MTSPEPVDQVSTTYDFDAFWTEHGPTEKRKTVRIRGLVVPVPVDVPLRLQLGVETREDMTPEQVIAFVDDLYGREVREEWIRRGMGGHELGVILAWSSLQAQGEDVDFGAALGRATELAEQRKGEQDAAARAKATLGQAAAAAASGSVPGGVLPPTADEIAHAQAVLDAGKVPSSASGAPWRPTSDVSTGYALASSPSSGSGSSASFWQV